MTEARLESIPDFLESFGDALRDGDGDWLHERLHPAVTAFYGEDRCRAYARSRRGEARLSLVAAMGPMLLVWSAADGRHAGIADAVSAVVRFETPAGTTSQLCHFAYVDGRLHWFTDVWDRPDVGEATGSSPV